MLDLVCMASWGSSMVAAASMAGEEGYTNVKMSWCNKEGVDWCVGQVDWWWIPFVCRYSARALATNSPPSSLWKNYKFWYLVDK